MALSADQDALQDRRSVASALLLPGTVEAASTASHESDSDPVELQGLPQEAEFERGVTFQAASSHPTDEDIRTSRHLRDSFKSANSGRHTSRSHRLSGESYQWALPKRSSEFISRLRTDDEDGCPSPRTLARVIINHRYFTGTIAACIMLNALYMYFETDFEDSLSPSVWRGIEFSFAGIFLTEIFLRMFVHRCAFFFGSMWEVGWNYFDLVLVSLAVLEPFLVLVFVSIGRDLGVFSGMRILRILRILRIARVFRLLHFFKELWLLVVGVFEAMRTLVWAWLLIFMLIFIFGIFITRSVGKPHRGQTCGDAYEGMDVDTLFGTLPTSMFTLFAVMTTEGWADIARCAMLHEGWTWVFFVLYLATTTFAMMNVVVAVIVEGTLEQSVKRKGEAERCNEEKNAKSCAQIAKLFRTADNDGDGELTKDEFLTALKRPEIMNILLEVGLDMRNAESLFDILDYDGSGALDVQEFIEGVMRASGEAQAKDILAVQCDLSRAERMFKQDLSHYKEDVFQKISHINADIDMMHASVLSAMSALQSPSGGASPEVSAFVPSKIASVTDAPFSPPAAADCLCEAHLSA